MIECILYTEGYLEPFWIESTMAKACPYRPTAFIIIIGILESVVASWGLSRSPKTSSCKLC